MTSAGIDSAMERNRAFAEAGGYEGAVVFPNLRLFVITCIDPRVDPAHFLGQLAEDRLPDGPLFEVAVIHHTECGTGALADDAFRGRYAERIGAEESTLRERAVLDPRATVTRDVERLRSARAISPHITVSGHVYDVATGLVEPVLPA
jgi:carbonic anhydrase